MSAADVTKMTEKALVDAVLARDRRAQKELFDRFAGKMMTVCLRYAKDHAQAEDVLQDSFIKVFKYLEQFNFEGSFEGWIRRIVVHTALKINTKKSSKMEIYGNEDYVMDNRVEMPDVYGQLGAEDIMKLIDVLPDGYKVVFNLYAVEGYSHKEIADMLNIGESTSRSQLLKARRMLKIELEKLNKIAV